MPQMTVVRSTFSSPPALSEASSDVSSGTEGSTSSDAPASDGAAAIWAGWGAGAALARRWSATAFLSLAPGTPASADLRSSKEVYSSLLSRSNASALGSPMSALSAVATSSGVLPMASANGLMRVVNAAEESVVVMIDVSLSRDLVIGTPGSP